MNQGHAVIVLANVYAARILVLFPATHRYGLARLSYAAALFPLNNNP